MTNTMGCDFYTLYKVCIEYIKNNEKAVYTYNLDDTRERHDWRETKRDEDFEEWEDYHKRRSQQHDLQIQTILDREYPRVVLCENGEWKCTTSARQNHLEIASKEHILEESIMNVWKEGEYWVR